MVGDVFSEREYLSRNLKEVMKGVIKNLWEEYLG